MSVWPSPETKLDIGLRKLRDYRGGAVLSDAEADALTAELEKAHHNLSNLEVCITRRDALEAAMRHVIEASPGTPDSVKKYLVRALEGSWGEPYEDAMVDSPE